MQNTSEWIRALFKKHNEAHLKALKENHAGIWFTTNRADVFEAEILERIAAERAEAVKERSDLINLKFKALEAGLIAVSHNLDKPFPDDPRWTPWSRFILPRAKMVREAIKGNDIGEMAAMAAQSKPKEKEES